MYIRKKTKYLKKRCKNMVNMCKFCAFQKNISQDHLARIENFPDESPMNRDGKQREKNNFISVGRIGIGPFKFMISRVVKLAFHQKIKPYKQNP